MLRGFTDRDVMHWSRKDWKHEFVICSPSRLTGEAVLTLVVPRGVDEKETAFPVVIHGAHRVVPLGVRAVHRTIFHGGTCDTAGHTRGRVIPGQGTPQSGTLWGRGGHPRPRALARRAEPRATGPPLATLGTRARVSEPGP
jgi:hypothetical protein